MDSLVFILFLVLLVVLPIVKWKMKAVIVLVILIGGGFITCGGNFFLAQNTGAFEHELQGVGIWIILWFVELIGLFFLGIWTVKRLGKRKQNPIK